MREIEESGMITRFLKKSLQLDKWNVIYCDSEKGERIMPGGVLLRGM